MLIEIFLDDNTVWPRVSSFRHSWSNNPKNKPIKENTYNIEKKDFKDLVLALDHYAILWTPMSYDFQSGNLFLKIIDNAGYYYKKGEFLDNVLK